MPTIPRNKQQYPNNQRNIQQQYIPRKPSQFSTNMNSQLQEFKAQHAEQLADIHTTLNTMIKSRDIVTQARNKIGENYKTRKDKIKLKGKLNNVIVNKLVKTVTEANQELTSADFLAIKYVFASDDIMGSIKTIMKNSSKYWNYIKPYIKQGTKLFSHVHPAIKMVDSYLEDDQEDVINNKQNLSTLIKQQVLDETINYKQLMPYNKGNRNVNYVEALNLLLAINQEVQPLITNNLQESCNANVCKYSFVVPTNSSGQFAVKIICRAASNFTQAYTDNSVNLNLGFTTVQPTTTTPPITATAAQQTLTKLVPIGMNFEIKSLLTGFSAGTVLVTMNNEGINSTSAFIPYTQAYNSPTLKDMTWGQNSKLRVTVPFYSAWDQLYGVGQTISPNSESSEITIYGTGISSQNGPYVGPAMQLTINFGCQYQYQESVSYLSTLINPQLEAKDLLKILNIVYPGQSYIFREPEEIHESVMKFLDETQVRADDQGNCFTQALNKCDDKHKTVYQALYQGKYSTSKKLKDVWEFLSQQKLPTYFVDIPKTKWENYYVMLAQNLDTTIFALFYDMSTKECHIECVLGEEIKQWSYTKPPNFFILPIELTN